jgi:hypothetical protein
MAGPCMTHKTAFPAAETHAEALAKFIWTCVMS